MCPDGTYRDKKRGKSSSDCFPCPPGKYCNTASGTDPRSSKSALPDCQDGFYCSGGASTQNQENCPAGHYCPTGTVFPVPCPEGQFKASDGQNTGCDQCTAGQYCHKRGLTAPAGDCLPGFFCPLGSKSPQENLCTAGTYSDATTGFAVCANCLPGTFREVR